MSEHRPRSKAKLARMLVAGDLPVTMLTTTTPADAANTLTMLGADVSSEQRDWEPTWYAVPGNGWNPANLQSSGDGWDNMAVFDWTGHLTPNVRWNR